MDTKECKANPIGKVINLHRKNKSTLVVRIEFYQKRYKDLIRMMVGDT